MIFEGKDSTSKEEEALPHASIIDHSYSTVVLLCIMLYNVCV
jgi:hypothetical protein